MYWPGFEPFPWANTISGNGPRPLGIQIVVTSVRDGAALTCAAAFAGVGQVRSTKVTSILRTANAAARVAGAWRPAPRHRPP